MRTYNQKSFLIGLLIFISICTGAQSISRFVISSYGAYNTNESVSLSSTLGEVAIETFSSGDWIITQGFNQSLEISETSIPPEQTEGGVRTFPNPARDILKLEIVLNNPENLILEVYDIIGNNMLTRNIDYPGDAYTYSLNLSHLEKGIYILRLYSFDKELITVTKLQKQ